MLLTPEKSIESQNDIGADIMPLSKTRGITRLGDWQPSLCSQTQDGSR